MMIKGRNCLSKKNCFNTLLSIMILVWMLPFTVIAAPDNIDARSLAREMINIVVPVIQDKDVVIQNKISDTVKLSKVNKDRFGELLTNILLNAVASSPEKGRIQISYNEGMQILEVVVYNSETRFDASRSIKDLKGNTVTIESKAGQGVFYRAVI